MINRNEIFMGLALGLGIALSGCEKPIRTPQVVTPFPTNTPMPTPTAIFTDWEIKNYQRWLKVMAYGIDNYLNKAYTENSLYMETLRRPETITNADELMSFIRQPDFHFWNDPGIQGIEHIAADGPWYCYLGREARQKFYISPIPYKEIYSRHQILEPLDPEKFGFSISGQLNPDAKPNLWKYFDTNELTIEPSNLEIIARQVFQLPGEMTFEKNKEASRDIYGQNKIVKDMLTGSYEDETGRWIIVDITPNGFAEIRVISSYN